MKKLISIFIVVFVILPSIKYVTAEPTGCMWQAHGCVYVVFYHADGNNGTAAVDCGDGFYTYGEGPVGGCTGVEIYQDHPF